MKFDRHTIIVLIILLIGLAVRIYRLNELTEFLGDQGRESIVLYNAWETKTLPLIGPPVSTGQHLGPAYYYLIAPSFYLANFDPIGPIVFMVLIDALAIVTLFWLISRLFSKDTALILCLLYALSPLIVHASRSIWNPTPIPLFTTLLLASLYEALVCKKFTWLYMSFACIGVLVQLHYSTILLIPLTGVALLAAWVKFKHDRTPLLINTLMGGCITIVLLLPFFIYQSQHTWTDIRSLVSFAGSQNDTPVRVDIEESGFVIQHLVNFIAPSAERTAALILLGVFLATSLYLKSKWSLLSWGIIAIAVVFISKTVYSPPEHYTRYLIPFLYITAAPAVILMQKIHKYAPHAAALLIVVAVYIPKSDIFTEGTHDLARTQDMVHTIMHTDESDSYSFALIKSRSFSDLHYRFYFLVNNQNPLPVESDEFTRLYVVCEKDPCPTQDDVIQLPAINVLCFDPLCNREYPTISMTEWEFDSLVERERATLYIFNRKNTIVHED